jgi:hypothetical protein
MVKLAAAALLAVVFAATLVLLTHRARTEGRLTHCRNNLRQIGVLSHQAYAMGWESLAQTPERGRALLQVVRESKYQDARGKWVRGNPLNPFGCPVRAVHAADLSKLSDAEYTTLMADPTTIDYLGPGALPAELKSGEQVVWAADRAGNHPQGGYVLLGDFTQSKPDKAFEVVDGWERAAVLRD